MRKIMKIYSHVRILCFFIFSLMIITTCLFFQNQQIVIFEWSLDLVGVHNFNLPIILDKPGLLFARTVIFISANVLLFSNRYIHEDKHNNRFIIIILLFIISINLLIFVPHLVFLLCGWDGLGLVRFLLVIHYNTPSSLAAGYITIFTNRIGDALIIVSIPLLLLGDLNLNPSSIINPQHAILITAILTLAAITKRAQIPFSSWLPAAIAAPTPISALVHSSTLVTAGVFLLFRFYPALSMSHIFRPTLIFFSSLTILIAGIRALKETDIKKIIALSTLRQLGVIIFSLRINLPELAFFHILTHATFKALLFICAGNIILQISHTQDLRQFGNLGTKHPITISAIIVSNLRLVGFPFLAGFYSKDLIIEIVMFNSINLVIFIIIVVATILTLLYTLRFIFFTFFNSSNRGPLIQISNRDCHINKRITIITIYVILRGPLLINNFLFPYTHPTLIPTLKWLIIISLITSLIVSVYLFFIKSLQPPVIEKNEFRIRLWFINFLNSQLFIKFFFPRGVYVFKTVDRSWNESLLGQGLKSWIILNSSNFIKWQNFIVTSNFLILIILLLIIYFDSLKKAL